MGSARVGRGSAARAPLGQLDKWRKLDFTLDEAGLVAPHCRVRDKHLFGYLIELGHVGTVEKKYQVVNAGELVAKLDLWGLFDTFQESTLSLLVGVFTELEEHECAKAPLRQPCRNKRDRSTDPAVSSQAPQSARDCRRREGHLLSELLRRQRIVLLDDIEQCEIKTVSHCA